jgi:hypothetical protein
VGLPGGGFAMLWRGSPVGATLIGSRAVLNSIKFMVSGHQCLMPAPSGNILDINGPACKRLSGRRSVLGVSRNRA